MRFVSPRNEVQQVVSALHRVREGLVRDRTGTINQSHAFLLEFGVSLPRGMAVIRRLPVVLAAEPRPPRLIALLERLQAHFKYPDEQIAQIGRVLLSQLHEDERNERLLEIPGIVPMTASVLMSELGNARQLAPLASLRPRSAWCLASTVGAASQRCWVSPPTAYRFTRSHFLVLRREIREDMNGSTVGRATGPTKQHLDAAAFFEVCTARLSSCGGIFPIHAPG